MLLWREQKASEHLLTSLKQWLLKKSLPEKQNREQLVLQTVKLIDSHSKNLDFTAEAYKAVVQCTHSEPKAVMDTQSQRYLKQYRGEKEKESK